MIARAVKKQHMERSQKRPAAPLLKLVVSNIAPATARTLGYARVSTEEQVLDMQLTALSCAGVQDRFVEKVSSAYLKRPQFNLMMKQVERGDTIVVYAFNRISRDLKFLLTFVDDMKALGVKLHSTSEPHIDPYTTNGRLLISVTGAVDENERGRVRDRTIDGMAEKRRQGMALGRSKMFDAKQTAAIKRDRKALGREAAAKKWKCSPGTIDKYSN